MSAFVRPVPLTTCKYPRQFGSNLWRSRGARWLLCRVGVRFELNEKGGERGKGIRRENDEVKEKKEGERKQRKERGRKGKRKRTREGGREK